MAVSFQTVFANRLVTPLALTLAASGLAGCAGQGASIAHAPRATAPKEIRSNMSPAAALHRYAEDYWQETLALNPELALSVGDDRYLARFNESLTDAYRRNSLALAQNYLSRLTGIDSSTLSDEDRLTLDIFRHDLNRDVLLYGGDLFRMIQMLPVNQFDGPHNSFAVEASGASIQPFTTLAHYELALQRDDAFALWVDQAIARMKEGVAAGIVQPRVLMEKLLPQLQAHLNMPPEKTVFWRPVENMPADFDAADRARLTAAFHDKIAQVIQPAYQRLYDYIARDYMKATRDTVGLSALPGGERLYAYDVAYHTSTSMTPREIHELGLSEVRRITAEFETVQRQIGFSGTLANFFAYGRNNKDLFFRSADQMLDRYRAARGAIEARLPQYFKTFPKADFVIKPVPAFMEKTQAGAYFEQASPDGSRPGTFWLNTYDAASRPIYGVTTLTLHEAIPGHHFQLSIAQENADLPSIRKYDFSTAYIEGWALYCESLGREMGLYQDPWQYYGHLNDEMLRANRLVVDTGLHALGWTRQQAIDFMMADSPDTETNVTAEVDRYIALPGQALSYKIGQLKLWQLRHKAETELGAKFDIRDFHDQILAGGSMPLSELESKINRWIAARK